MDRSVNTEQRAHYSIHLDPEHSALPAADSTSPAASPHRLIAKDSDPGQGAALSWVCFDQKSLSHPMSLGPVSVPTCP